MSNTQSNNETSGADENTGLELDVANAEAIKTLAVGSKDVAVAAEDFDCDTLFEVLADPGRRYVLTYLLQSEGAVSCSDLVDYIINQTEQSMSRDEFRQRVVTELTRKHLPKLDDYGCIQYNLERQMIGPTDLTPLARPYLGLALAHKQVADVDTED
jgi:hypothetical protein